MADAEAASCRPGISRRAFAALGGVLVADAALPPIVHAAVPVRAEELVASLPGSGVAQGPTLIAGDPAQAVSGVALLTVPSIAALRRAIDSGCNLVVSPESLFYARPPQAIDPASPMAEMARRSVAMLEADPVYRAKQALIRDHKLTVYRLPDLPSGIWSAALTAALAARLGWNAYRVAGERPVYAPPDLTLAGLVRLAHEKLGATGGLRFIGDPAMPIRTVLLVPGTAEDVSTVHALRGVDALFTGDLREWEIVEYLFDSRNAGEPKALVATGRILSEQPFVAACAEAVRRAHPGLRLFTAQHGDPFWRVQA